jgi:hypothetical protein
MSKSFTALLSLLLFPAALAAQQALLWVPAGQEGVSDIVGVLEGDKDLRLTAAFDGLPKGLEDRVKKLEKDSRLELALRPAGDPPLPLLYYPASSAVKWAAKPSTAAMTSDQYFLGLRLGLARDAALKEYKKVPAGLVATPGGLVADYFPLARAMGIKWLACGPLASTAAATLEAGGVAAVPFSLARSSAAAGPFLVFDETSAADPAGVRAWLAAALKAPGRQKLLTVSEALKTATSTAAAPADIEAAAAPWSGDYTAWASSAAQAGALAALAKTRADLMLYVNSFQGNYKPAAPAFAEYFSAEEGARLLALGRAADGDNETERGIQDALGNVYRIMQKPPPPWLFSGLADAAAPGQQEEKLAVTVKNGGFEITNIPRKPELPEQAPLLPGSDPYKVWKLSSMKVEISADNLVFSFTPGELQNPARSPSGFGVIRLDIYIDINHRARAGMTRPLDGRPLRLFPEDAWEYALEITPARATLYTVTPRGPVRAGFYPARAEGGAVTVRVPRTALRGSPLLWGYAALLLAPKGANGLMITDYIASDVANGYIYDVRPGDR